MKKLLLLTNLLVLCLYINAQTGHNIDPRLQEIYTANYSHELSSEEIKYMNWYLDNSYSIDEVTEEKSDKLPYLRHFDPQTKTTGDIVQDIDPENFNIYLYSFERYYDRGSVYRIGNSGKIIFFDSYETLAKKYNKYQGYEN